ncbi:CHAT domain-containing protein [Sphaerisporangium fuscum]|uniref:CHAT domain-containing protein n=1 Tax=Sphaerisporangium fuscum TaxID=2835868 RepID=UPI001BDD48DD|nr:CHAT domain-containing protein [Sphaerisporangium fuscum]
MTEIAQPPRQAAGGATDELVSAAEEAVTLSGADPLLARERAGAVLRRAEAVGCLEAVSVAHRALALAAREFGHLALAADHLERAVTAARDHPVRAAQARLSLVTVRADLGDPVGGLRVADLAEAHLTGLDPARLGVQRAVALVRLGRNHEAVAHCDRAVERLTGADDPRFLAGALLNRGIAHTYLERYDAASRDLSRCVAVAREAGLDHIASLAKANVPFVATRRGDIPAAFAGYRAAEEALADYPERLAATRADFAGALLAAYLPGEARVLLGQAVPELAAAGALVAVAESRLLLAQLELLVGDPYQAKATAEAAAQELTSQGRHAWVPLAEEVALRARLATERPGRELLGEVRALAARLAGQGWTAPAAGLRLTAAELAVDLGEQAVAEDELRSIIGEQAVAQDPPGVAAPGEPPSRTHRIVRHHATAMGHGLRGDLAEAFAALRLGIAEAAAGSEGLGDPGVRAHALRAGERLAEYGLTLALREGHAEDVLGWAEHCRAVARGRLGETMPPGRLRAVLGDIALIEMVRSGDHLSAVVVTSDGCVLRPLGSYTDAAEATIRLRYGMRRAGLRDTGRLGGVLTEAEGLARLLLGPLADAMGDRPAVVVPTGALHTLPWPVLPPFRGRPLCVSSSAAAWAAARTGSPSVQRRRLHRTTPRRPGAGEAEHPPSEETPTHHRPITTPAPAPEPALTKTETTTTIPTPDNDHPSHHRPIVVAVAGPGLIHAETEAAMVVHTHEGHTATSYGTTPRGDMTEAAEGAGATSPGREPAHGARVEVVLEALGRADILHVAAHGTFCARSPLLSSIALDDGPLMAYDLLRLRRAPGLVVLSACDAGMAHAPVDGAPLGLAGAFLDRGTACVVAGLVPVRDEEALALMTRFHALLVAGRTPAEALATAAELTGVTGFACFGSHGHPLGLEPP